MLAVIPELELVFVHRVDTDHGFPNYTSLPVFRLLDIFLAARESEPVEDARLTPLSSTPLEPSSPRPEPGPVDLDPDLLDSYAGEYDWNGALITIELRDGRLVFLEGADRMYMCDLIPESMSSFLMSDSKHRKIEFVRGQSGGFEFARIIEEGVVMSAPRADESRRQDPGREPRSRRR